MNFFELCKNELKDVENEINAMLEKRDERTFGVLPSFFSRGGKRLRPLLVFLFFHALNGKDAKNAKKIAALIEMFHNFTLIHDDIEDDSKFRRGKPTLHIEHGVPIAINSGDALYTLVLKEMSEIDLPSDKVAELIRRSSNSFLSVVEGQGAEIFWEKANKFDITEEEYYDMIAKKTGALISLSCEMGAFIADATKEEQEMAAKFGRNIGIAFQITDDVLNLVGTFEHYKKEIGGDITEGKRTLMVIKTLEIASEEDRRRLKEILSSHTTNQREINEAIEIIKKYGSIEYAKNKANELVVEAKAIVAKLNPSPYKEALFQICDYVLNRES